jgi:PTS system mannose-specific IIC component
MFTFMQILLTCLFVFFMSLIGWSAQIFAYGVQVLYGMVTGLIMGDVKTGLTVGGTMCLMGLGIGGFGGSSVPDYALGTTVGTLFAISSGSGLEAGLAVGIPVATLGTEFDVLFKMMGSFFIHKEMEASDKADWKGMTFWVWGWMIARSFFYTLPVLLVMTVGSGLINSIIAAIPTWLMNGLTVCAGLLPGLGFAILMKYLPIKKWGIFLVFGFVLYSYGNMPMLAIACLSAVVAYLVFMYLENNDKLVKAQQSAGTVTAGGANEDE